MAAFFKLPAPPGRVRTEAAPRPALSVVWRFDGAGRLVRRWRTSAGREG